MKFSMIGLRRTAEVIGFHLLFVCKVNDEKTKKNLKSWSIRYKEAVMNTLVILFFSQNILKIILFSKSASLVIL